METENEDIPSSSPQQEKESSKEVKPMTPWHAFLAEHSAQIKKKIESANLNTRESEFALFPKLASSIWKSLNESEKEKYKGILPESKCPKCHREYNQQGKLTQHKRICKECVCPECSKSFSNLLKLKNHEIVVHRRTYICQICKGSFKSESVLRRHQKIHVIVEHICDKCEFKFSSFAKLQKHIERVHRHVEESEIEEQLSKSADSEKS